MYLLLLLELLRGLLASSTAHTTSAAGSNETDLLTGGSIAGDCGSVADVLLVTTTVRVFNRVHSHTTDAGPLVALDAVLVVAATSLEHGLVDTTTAGDDADLGTAGGGEGRLATGGQAETGLARVAVVGDDGGVVTGGAGELAAVTGLLLNVADDGTFGHGTEGHDVADLELSRLAAVDELTGVQTLDSDEVLAGQVVLVRVAENNAGEGGTTTGVMDDLPDNTLDVAVTLGEVERAELGSSLSVLGVGLEDTARTLTLSSDNATHLV